MYIPFPSVTHTTSIQQKKENEKASERKHSKKGKIMLSIRKSIRFNEIEEEMILNYEVLDRRWKIHFSKRERDSLDSARESIEKEEENSKNRFSFSEE